MVNTQQKLKEKKMKKRKEKEKEKKERKREISGNRGNFAIFNENNQIENRFSKTILNANNKLNMLTHWQFNGRALGLQPKR